MRKSEIELIQVSEIQSKLENDLISMDMEINEENLQMALGKHKRELNKQRVQEFKNRIDSLNEATIAYHAAFKSISNKALMIRDIIESDDLETLIQLEIENTDIVNQLNNKKTKEENKKTDMSAAKDYLSTINKGDITTLTKAKEMLWHLKNLIETE